MSRSAIQLTHPPHNELLIGGPFPRVSSGRGVKLMAHIYRVRKLIIGGMYVHLPVYTPGTVLLASIMTVSFLPYLISLG